MALITVYQGDSKTLVLTFLQDDLVTPVNVSGFLVRGVARANYGADPIIDTTVTGVAPYAVTGTVFFPLTTGDTNHCIQDYVFGFAITDLSTGVSSYPTDGLRILPNAVY